MMDFGVQAITGIGFGALESGGLITLRRVLKSSDRLETLESV